MLSCGTNFGNIVDKMSNAKLYSSYKILSSDFNDLSECQIEYHEKMYYACDNEDKADNLEVSCRYLKYRLTYVERKYLQIPDLQ